MKTIANRFPWTVRLLALTAVLMLASYRSWSQAQGGPCTQTHFESIHADSDHYLPGDTVPVAGHGFGFSCDLTMVVNLPDGTSESWPLTSDNANLDYSYVLGPVTGDYSIQAVTGDGISLATTYFNSGPYVKTDKMEYSPGETVTFSGRGFQAEETINLVVQDTREGVQPDRTFTTVANGSGAFFNTDLVVGPQDQRATLLVSATGQSSGISAEQKFSDATVNLIQKTANQTTAAAVTSITGTYSPAPTSGNLLVAIVGSFNSNTTSMTSSGWTQAINQTGSPTQAIFYKLAGLLESTSVQVAFSGASFSRSGSMSFDGPTKRITLAGANFTQDGFAPLQTISITSPSNNGTFTLATVGTTTMTVNETVTTAAAGATTITGNGTTATIQLYEYNGIITSSDPLDSTSSQTGSGSPSNSGTVATTFDTDLLVAGMTGAGGAVNATFGASTQSFLDTAPNNVSNSGTSTAMRVGSRSADRKTSGANNFTTMTIGAGVPWRGQIVAFKTKDTSTTISVSPASPVIVGATVTLTATIDPGVATGTVTFVDNVTTLCASAPVVSGQATCVTTSLAAGNHSLIKATYNGSSDYVASTSANLPTYSVQAAAAGDCFRSDIASGNWNVTGNWQAAKVSGGACPTDPAAWVTATLVPSNSASGIEIRSGHTITVSAAATARNLTVNSGGDLEVASGFTLNYGTASANVMLINGVVGVSGTLTQQGSNDVEVGGTGILTIKNGGLINGGGGNGATTTFLLVDSGGQWTIDSGGSYAPSGTNAVNVKPGSTATLNGPVSAGDTITLDGTVNASANITLTSISNLQIGGTVTMTAGQIFVSRGSAGTMGQINSGGSLILQGSALFNLSGQATSHYDVTSGGTLDIGPAATVIGTGFLQVNSGANLKIGSSDGITNSSATPASGPTACTIPVAGGGNVQTCGNADAYNIAGNYTYDGTAAQVTGNALPATVNSLTVNNSGGNVTLTNGVTVTSALNLTQGDLSTGAGANLLKLQDATTCNGTTDVISLPGATGGVFRSALTALPTGTPLCYGNPNNQITINSGSSSALTIRLLKSVPAGKTDAVTRNYQIIVSGTGLTTTARLHYLDSELNGNAESALELWRAATAAGPFVNQGQTGRDGTANWVEKTGVSDITLHGNWTFAASNATIKVTKVTNPAGGGPFTFTSADGGPAGSISDGGVLTATVAAGTYHSVETVPSDYTLTSIVCDDAGSTGDTGTATATFTVTAGQTVNCTFTDVKKGSIKIVKNTTGGDGTFNYTVAGPDSYSASPSVTTSGGTGDTTLSDVPAGSGYSASETVPAGWDLTASSCDNGTPGSFSVPAGGMVTCTFTNVKKGHVVVTKVTDPVDNSVSFSLHAEGTGTITPPANRTIQSGTPQDFEVTPGTYRVGELAQAGWDQTGNTCQGLVVAAGATVPCTITNTKKGSIHIVKNTTGGDTTFNYTLSGPNSYSASPSVTTSGGTGDTTLTDVSAGSGYSASETVPAGWDLTASICDNGTPASFSVPAGGTVTCTFTNVKKGHVVVTKVTDPVDNSVSFSLHAEGTGTITPPANRTIQSGTPQDFEVTPGTYRVGELAQAGWDQTGNTCQGLVVAAGATVPCTITNTKKGTITINKTATGGDTTFNFTASGPNSYSASPSITTSGGTGTTSLTDVSAGAGYSLSETVPGGWDLTASSCDNGTPGSFSVPAGGTVTCSFTNVKKGHVVVTKVTDPALDPTLFNLHAEGTGTITPPANRTISTASPENFEVTPGTYRVAEFAQAGWDITGNTCQGLVVAAGATVPCTITNTKKATLTVNKVTNPTTDPGLFNLQIDGTTYGVPADQGNGGTTGAVSLTPGLHTVSELAGTGTTLADYSASFNGDCAADGTITLGAGDNKVCTITNTKKPKLTVNKVTDPADDTGLFNLQIDGTTAGTGANQGNGGSTGAVTLDVISQPDGTGAFSAGLATGQSFTAATTGFVTEIHVRSRTTTTSANLHIYNGNNGSGLVGSAGLPAYSQAIASLTDAGGDSSAFPFSTIVLTTPFPVTALSQYSFVIEGASISGILTDHYSGGTKLDDYAGISASQDTAFQVIYTHTVGETAGAGTTLSDYTAVISGDCAADGTISLVPGDNKTCTITNTRKGSIHIVKNTTGGDDTFSFSVAGPNSYSASPSITTTAGTGDTTLSSVSAGSGYSASETVPAGWDLTASICDNGTPASFSVPAGGTVTCTFTNVKKGHVVVTKVTDPVDNSVSFSLHAEGTGTITPPANRTIQSGTPQDFEVTPGTYRVGELAQAGWDQTGNTCQGLVVAAGATVPCTITNTKKGTITINKTATGGNTTFNFTASGPNSYSASPSITTSGGTGTTSLTDVSAGAGYSLSETIPGGWDLTAASCDNGTPGSFSVPAGGTVTCSFTNVKKGHVVVTKVTSPVDNSVSFSLHAEGTGTITPPANRSIQSGTPQDFEVTPGTYRVAELAQAGWVQSGNTCQGLIVAAGATVNCMITNQKDDDGDGIPNAVDCSPTVHEDAVVDPGNVVPATFTGRRYNTLQAAVSDPLVLDNSVISMYANTTENVTIGNTTGSGGKDLRIIGCGHKITASVLTNPVITVQVSAGLANDALNAAGAEADIQIEDVSVLKGSIGFLVQTTKPLPAGTGTTTLLRSIRTDTNGPNNGAGPATLANPGNGIQIGVPAVVSPPTPAVPADGNEVRGANSISTNAGDGINVNGSNNMFKTNKIQSNKGDGMDVTGGFNTITGSSIGEKNLGNTLNGILVTGDHNTINENDVFGNKKTGINVTGMMNLVYKNDVGDKDKGNGAGVSNVGGIWIRGNSNMLGKALNENNVFANVGIGVSVEGDFNMVVKNDVGDTGKGNTGIGIKVSGKGNELDQNNVFANGGDGINTQGSASGTTTIDGTPMSHANQITNNTIGDRGKGNGGNGLVAGVAADFGNIIHDNTIFANSKVGMVLAGGSGQIYDNTIGDTSKGNGTGGVSITGNSNTFGTAAGPNQIFANTGAGPALKVSGNSNSIVNNNIGDNGKGNTGDGINVSSSGVGAGGNIIDQNSVYANTGDGIDVSGGTAGNPNVITNNRVGDDGKGNGGNGILLAGTGGGTSNPIEVNANTARANTLNGIKVTGTGHQLANNISGGTNSGQNNGDCEYTVVAGNFNATGNTANGAAIPGALNSAFPTTCQGTP